MDNYGYQNELDFVNLYNEKYLNELDDNSQHFLIDTLYQLNGILYEKI